jgi:hypothetical protein
MAIAEPFDLSAFMLSNFPGVDFGGNLFGQRPTGMRFEIGIEQVPRAARLFDFLVSDAPDCILVSQDWVLDENEEERPLSASPKRNSYPSASEERSKRRIDE